MIVLKIRDRDEIRLIKYHADSIPIHRGGTGAVTVEEARYNLGIVSPTLATSMTDGLMSAEDKRRLDNLLNNTATQESSGLMSADDKKKLDNLSDAGANMDYSSSYNKPKIDGIVLEGDISSDSFLGTATDEDIDNLFS